jgi:hypothetical protein
MVAFLGFLKTIAGLLDWTNEYIKTEKDLDEHYMVIKQHILSNRFGEKNDLENKDRSNLVKKYYSEISKYDFLQINGMGLKTLPISVIKHMNGSLKSLNFSKNPKLIYSAEDLNVLEELKNLETLNVGGANLNKEQIYQIVNALPNLKTLNISYNVAIDSLHMLEWRNLKNLKNFHCQKCNLKRRDLIKMLQEGSRSITIINLEENEQIGYEMMDLFFTELKNCRRIFENRADFLKIYLKNCGISSENKEKLRKFETENPELKVRFIF